MSNGSHNALSTILNKFKLGQSLYASLLLVPILGYWILIAKALFWGQSSILGPKIYFAL